MLSYPARKAIGCRLGPGKDWSVILLLYGPEAIIPKLNFTTSLESGLSWVGNVLCNTLPNKTPPSARPNASNPIATGPID